nr:glycoprotein precursor [Aspen mosaic-associated virus]
MGIINAVIACLILLTMIAYAYTSIRPAGETCECEPKIQKLAKNFIVCFPGCQIKPVNSMLYNTSCMHMEDVTISICKGIRYISTKPQVEIHESYIWTTYVQRAWKLIVTIAVWIIIIVMKVPSLCMMSMMNRLLIKSIESWKNKCKDCGSDYLMSHIECPTPSFRHRTDYNFFFYILLVLAIITTFIKADDNVYNYYHHDNVTEVQILDREHYQQDFDVNGYLYTITILNSHLELDVVNISEIQMPIKHRIEKTTYSCDGTKGCESEFAKKYGIQPTWSVRKAHDGFSCFTVNAVVCGTCTNDYLKLGDKVTTTNVKPYVDIEVKHGNKTDVIKIREFSSFVHQPYYVKPIRPVLVDSVDMFITGAKVYKGQMCNMPSLNCFGPNYIKDGKIYQLMIPRVVDPMSYDREVILDNCVDPGNSDVNSLHLTDYIYQNNTIIKPFTFGMISMGIPASGKLIGDFCEKPVQILDIMVDGCYDCQIGIEVQVKYGNVERCAQIKCRIGRVAYEYFVDSSYGTMTLHSFYDKKTLTVECNGISKDFELEHSKDTSYYKTSNEVHGDTPSDFNIFKHLPNILINPKTILTTIFLCFIIVYMVISIAKHTVSHYMHIRSERRIRHYKKTDNHNMNTINGRLIIVEGEAQ